MALEKMFLLIIWLAGLFFIFALFVLPPKTRYDKFGAAFILISLVVCTMAIKMGV